MLRPHQMQEPPRHLPQPQICHPMATSQYPKPGPRMPAPSELFVDIQLEFDSFNGSAEGHQHSPIPQSHLPRNLERQSRTRHGSGGPPVVTMSAPKKPVVDVVNLKPLSAIFTRRM